MSERKPKYLAVSAGERLFQGELIAGVIQVRLRLDTIDVTTDRIVDEIVHPFSVVITQDCDLESDFRPRSAGKEGSSLLPSVLLCELVSTVDLKMKHQKSNSSLSLWNQVMQNKNERYQCFEEIPPDADGQGFGFPSLACDFKRYFTIATDELYKRIELGQIHRRSRLDTPYAEHFLSRYCYFQSRIGLPEGHRIQV